MIKILIVGALISVAFLSGNAISSKPGTPNNPQVQGVTQESLSISPQQFKDLLETNNYQILDIRTSEEYAAGHIKDSKQIDYYQTKNFSDYLDSLDKKGKYLIYCRTGNRTDNALILMQRKGFESVYELSGGYNAWVAAGLAIVK